MKRNILTLLFLLGAYLAQAQVWSADNIWGKQAQRFIPVISLGAPKDTFQIADLLLPNGTNARDNPWVAVIDSSGVSIPYYWNTTNHAWQRGAGSGTGTADGNNYVTNGYFTYNNLTISRNGLSDLNIAWDSTLYHSGYYYDTRYAQLVHGHIPSDIVGLSTAILNTFHSGTGINVDNTTGYISWTGTASGITSLNGLTGTTQTLAFDSTYNGAAGWVSVGTVHTLRLPARLFDTTGFISNQSASAQTGNFYISGNGRASQFRSSNGGFYFAGSDNTFYDGISYLNSDILQFQTKNYMKFYVNTSTHAFDVRNTDLEVFIPLKLTGSTTYSSGGFDLPVLNQSTKRLEYVSSLDSTKIPTLHSEAYYNTKYGSGGGGTDNAAYHTMTQVSDTSFSLNRPDGTKDTVVVQFADVITGPIQTTDHRAAYHLMANSVADSNIVSGVSQSKITNLTSDLAAKQPNIQFKDEGTNIGTSGGVTNVNFTGAGVTASHSSGTVTVNIPGGGGSGGGLVAGMYKWLKFTIDSTNAPTAGKDSIDLSAIVPTGMHLQYNREYSHEHDSVSYWWNATTRVLKVSPAWYGGEHNELIFTPDSLWTALSLPAPVGYDADAQTYFDAVATNGGTLSTPEKDDINTFVVGLKTDGLWTGYFDKIHFTIESDKVGEINLMNPSGTKATFVNSPSFSSTGVTLNGTNQYINSHWIGGASSNATDYHFHISAYERTAGATAGVLFGVKESANGADIYFYPYMSGNIYYRSIRYGQVSTTASTGTGLFFGESIGTTANTKKLYRDATLVFDGDDTGNAETLPDVQPLYFGAYNNNTVIQEYRACEISMYTTGKDLNSTQYTNFKNRVTTLKTSRGW
jgi:hypothetical protein